MKNATPRRTFLGQLAIGTAGLAAASGTAGRGRKRNRGGTLRPFPPGGGTRPAGRSRAAHRPHGRAPHPVGHPRLHRRLRPRRRDPRHPPPLLELQRRPLGTLDRGAGRAAAFRPPSRGHRPARREAPRAAEARRPLRPGRPGLHRRRDRQRAHGPPVGQRAPPRRPDGVLAGHARRGRPRRRPAPGRLPRRRARGDEGARGDGAGRGPGRLRLHLLHPARRGPGHADPRDRRRLVRGGRARDRPAPAAARGAALARLPLDAARGRAPARGRRRPRDARLRGAPLRRPRGIERLHDRRRGHGVLRLGRPRERDVARRREGGLGLVPPQRGLRPRRLRPSLAPAAPGHGTRGLPRARRALPRQRLRPQPVRERRLRLAGLLRPGHPALAQREPLLVVLHHARLPGLPRRPRPRGRRAGRDRGRPALRGRRLPGEEGRPPRATGALRPHLRGHERLRGHPGRARAVVGRGAVARAEREGPRRRSATAGSCASRAASPPATASRRGSPRASGS